MKTQTTEKKSARPRPIPDGLVVLTFDDGCKSDAEFVAPLLKEFGFGATFFVNNPSGTPEGWNARNAKNYAAWDQIAGMHKAGFEIGNHTVHHPNVSAMSKQAVIEELNAVEYLCAEHGISRPVSFCFPGFSFGRNAIEALKEKGYSFARRGAFPECRYDDKGQRGPVYDPHVNHPLLIPTTGFSGPHWGLDDLLWTISQARDGKIAVLCFHGVPDVEHAWVHTDPQAFKEYMQHLRERDCTVIAMRDLAKYIDILAAPNDPLMTKERVNP
ncbi:MAG: polysaccharide deacetylase family protein [Kiritimatiellaeota bacterium]|nr:polysaccharide deacetylase family protein [Kiritimatiellota bacterium]